MKLIEQHTNEVMRWTKGMNSLTIKGYLDDWIEHYCFIPSKIQIQWWEVTGYIPQPHYGGYWMTYDNWRELKKRDLKL